MRYAEIAIVGSFVFGVATSAGDGKQVMRLTGDSPHPELVRCEAAAVPVKVDVSTDGFNDIATLKTPEGEK